MATLLLIAHTLGIVSSFDSLMRTRTSQGAIAWIFALNTVPLLAVPAYWVFGRTRFHGYATLRQQVDATKSGEVAVIREKVAPFVRELHTQQGPALAGARLAKLPYLTRNAVELLIDGKATFESVLDGIAAAKDYVIVQFYIVHDDEVGRALKDRMMTAARDGRRVYFLYDEIGSAKLPGAYLQDLRRAGVQARSFHTTRGAWNRFQINFRNHRKIVVVDGKHGWIGGLNVGDEYLGHSKTLPNWRDTHMKVSGPAVLELQLSFVEDWLWATDEHLAIPWDPHPSEKGDATVLILPTGPADRLETASLMYQQAIHAARERIWIASPYFIPDEGVLSALHLAALRGVDTRVIIPDKSDRWLVYMSVFALAAPLIESGVAIHRYEPGFLHQKVFLVDDRLAGVGTANLDNRSFRLNFEVTGLVSDPRFVEAVKEMLENDMARSRVMTAEEVAGKPFWFKALARASYLTSPIQ